MSNAAKQSDARYAEFVARMLAAEEYAVQFAADASRKLYTATSNEQQNAATVRPSK